jgi:eukaryotic-like serine/threonine-protein kinase
VGSEEIGGRYSVIERIGKGAMGVVYKAYDPVLDRVVAIKKMASEIVEDEELRQRFYVEARAAARLNHRHIVTIHELEEADGEIYIVMELLEGVDLASVIRRRVPLPLPAKLTIIGQLCEGLDYAHRHGIVHRDIKPGNVHLSPAGLVKILDFGIARLASSKMTGTGALLGTPDYMSPEQVLGESIDARSDLFAVGGVLYELLAGAKAFESETVASLLIKIAKNPHVPITDRVADLPISLVSLVNRLLAKDREQRPPTAGAVGNEIRGVLQSFADASEASAAAMIGGIVTEQTMMIANPPTGQPAGTPRPAAGTPRPAAGTPRPPGSSGAPRSMPRTANAPAPPVSASSSSDTRLASLALQRGRELRKSGDLAGAMQVFRSVLEVAPGNAEALEELQALEADLRQATARPGTTSPPAPMPADAPPAAAAILTASARDGAPTLLTASAALRPQHEATAAPVAPAAPTPQATAGPAPVVVPAAAAPTPAPAPVRKGKSDAAVAIVALLVLFVGGLAGAYYLLVIKRKPVQQEAAVTSSAPAPPAATVSVPPAAAAPGSEAATPSASPAAPPQPQPAASADTSVAAAPKPPDVPAVDPERVKAEAARTRLTEVRQARAAAGASALPVRTRNEALRFERQGTLAFENAEYARASVLFEEAARLVAMRPDGRGRGADSGTAAAGGSPATNPASVAASQQETRPATPTPDTRQASVPPAGRKPIDTTPFESRRGGPPPPDRPSEPALVRPPPRDTAPDISTFNRGAPSSVEQMFNATPSTRATIARITMLIEQYAKAMEQRDVETVRSIRSELSPLEQRILRQGKQVSYKLDGLNIQSDGAEGVATARRVASAELESGEKLTASGPVTIRLVRRPAGWIITDIR